MILNKNGNKIKMIYMRYWYKILFFFHKTVFRKNQKERLLSDINGFSFENINVRLKGMKVTVFNKTEDSFMVRYTDMHTEYILSFDKLGIVNKIELDQA